MASEPGPATDTSPALVAGDACSLGGACAPVGDIEQICFPKPSSMQGRCTFYCGTLISGAGPQDPVKWDACADIGGECREYKPGGVSICHLL